MCIMIVDDDIYIGDMVQKALEAEGYNILRAYSGTEAVLLLKNSDPDLILLDLMLPGLSGEQVLESIKGIPVIVVSAKVDVDDKVNLLLSGAADYITKPFELKELSARIKVALRRANSPAERELISCGDIMVDTVSHLVYVNNELLKLTRTEYAILKLLIINSGMVLSKSAILDRIADDTPDCSESSLKQHISNLRKKLRDATGQEHIESVWGIGFKFNP